MLPKSKIAVIQTASSSVVGINLVAVYLQLERAVEDGCRVVILPGLFAGIPENNQTVFDISEIEGGRVQTFLAQTAQKLGLWIVGGAIAIRAPNSVEKNKVFWRSCIWNDQGERVFHYDKKHLAQVDVGGPGPIDEPSVIEPGSVNRVIQTPCGVMGIAMDFDLYSAKHFKQLRDQGAEVIAVPALFYQRLGKHWEALLRVRAIEAQCYVLAANQWGELPDGRYGCGQSMVIDPWGDVLSRQDAYPGAITETLDFEKLYFLRKEVNLERGKA